MMRCPEKIRSWLDGVPAVGAWRLAAVIGGLLAFLVLVVFPLGRYAGRLESEVASLNTQWREQEMFYPLYKQLSEIMGVKMPGQLAAPKEGKLSQAGVADIPGLLGQIAGKCGVESVSAVPRVDSLSGGNLLQVEAVFAGELEKLRQLLIELGALPYVSRVDEIEVKVKGGKKELGLKMWLVVDMSVPT